MTCETCGKELAVGDWPFCPHDSTRDGNLGMLGEFHARIEEDLFPFPVEVTSLAQRKKFLRGDPVTDPSTGEPFTRGFRLEDRSNKRGMPGCEY